MKKIVLLVLFFTVQLSLAQDQNKKFGIKELPKNIVVKDHPLDKSIFKSYFDLTGVLPKGYVRDGSVDYTKFIQEGLSSHKRIKFPDFPVLINEDGLTIESNTILYFPEKSVLLLQPSAKGTYEILRLHNISNVELYNPVIVGDRESHKGKDGEWGMGISILGSDQVKIINPRIEKCWGDGIYIGRLKGKQTSNVNIYNAYLNNNRRNGTSITSGSNILMEHSVVLNTAGTSPQSGIVIEPNNPDAELNNIILKDIYTYNNYESGIQIGGLDKLISDTKKAPIRIDIINHIDNGSSNGMLIGKIPTAKGFPGLALTGVINIVNPTWENNRNATIVKRKQNGRGPKVHLSKLSNKARKQLWNPLKYDADVVFDD